MSGPRRRARWRWRRAEKQDGQSAEDALDDDGRERGQREKAQPAALFHSPGPDGENNGEQADEFCRHAMSMFVLDAANHLRDFVKGTKTGRPVGDRQTGVIAGDESSGNDQEQSGAGGEDGKAVQSAMVWNFDAFQDSPQWNPAVRRSSFAS
jgi:hypothetical protein